MPFKAGIHYSLHEGGKANQKPVILIHGAGSDHLIWPASIRRLVGHTVIALDLPGHGHSTGVGCQSIGDYTAAVTEFLATHGIFQAAFVGYGMGGAIALQLALDFPQHVIGVGIISAGAHFNLPGEMTAYLSNPATTAAGIQMLRERLVCDSPLAPVVSEGLKALTAARPSVVYNDWHACSRFDLSADLARINIPAYVACGAKDRLTSLNQAKLLAAGLPMAHMDAIHGAGHLLPREQPEVLAAGLKRFLDDLMDWQGSFPLPAGFPKIIEKKLVEKRKDTDSQG